MNSTKLASVALVLLFSSSALAVEGKIIPRDQLPESIKASAKKASK